MRVHNDLNQASLDLDAKSTVKQLRTKMLAMKGQFMDEDGKVKYLDLKKSGAYQEYVQFSSQLKHVNFDGMSDDDERRAFFINIYNCLTIHALVEMSDESGIPPAPIKVDNMWGSNAYNIGGEIYSLDDIEHGVLRGNKGHPSKAGQPQFPAEDPRLATVLPLDPRIHFALNCGANSCPPIGVYNGHALYRQLEMASNSFLESTVVVKADRVQLSKLLLWYREDFGTTDAQVLYKLSEIMTNPDLRTALKQASENGSKIDYAGYDWSLNSTS